MMRASTTIRFGVRFPREDAPYGLLESSMPSRPVPTPVALRARELRDRRRTRSGTRFRPWREIADMLSFEGFGAFVPSELAAAVSALPIDTHPTAPADAATISAREADWRKGWAEEFTDKPWPGLAEAQRQIRKKHLARDIAAQETVARDIVAEDVPKKTRA